MANRTTRSRTACNATGPDGLAAGPAALLDRHRAAQGKRTIRKKLCNAPPNSG